MAVLVDLAGLLRVVGSMSRSEGLRQVKGRQDDRIAELMKASPVGNIDPGHATDFIESVLAGYPDLEPVLTVAPANPHE